MLFKLLFKIFQRLRIVIKEFKEKKFRPFYLKKLAEFRGAKVEFGKNVRIGNNVCIELGKDSQLIIGDNSIIRDGCKVILHPKASFDLGHDSYIGLDCEIFSRSQIKIGSNVLLAQQCILIDYNHQWDKTGVKLNEFKTKPIDVSNNSWLGLRAVILAGGKIGNGSIIGAQEVVREEIPDHTLFFNNKKTEIVK